MPARPIKNPTISQSISFLCILTTPINASAGPPTNTLTPHYFFLFVSVICDLDGNAVIGITLAMAEFMFQRHPVETRHIAHDAGVDPAIGFRF